MCTLVLAWRVFDDWPVAVAANRDELLGRPSEPPARRDWPGSPVAPRDVEADGTWIGYNDDGVFAGITNRWLADSPNAERSRGLLVRDALAADSAAAATETVRSALAADSYDGFNLVVADAHTANLVEWDGEATVTALDPGLHVVVNVGADGRYAVPEHRPDAGRQQGENADAVRAALRPDGTETVEAWLDRAADVLADHDYGVCVHGVPGEGDGPDVPFGTRSSSLIALGKDGAVYRYADGPPCETAFEDVEGQV